MNNSEEQAPGRILLVDDEPELIEGFRLLLEEEGFQATVHTSLITLPFVLRSLNPDVILLDLSMPALSGQALFATGVHRLLRTSAPIILFSGRLPHELSKITEEIGADGFVSKAQDLEDVLRRIRLWIANRRAMKEKTKVWPPTEEGVTEGGEVGNEGVAPYREAVAKRRKEGLAPRTEPEPGEVWRQANSGENEGVAPHGKNERNEGVTPSIPSTEERRKNERGRTNGTKVHGKNERNEGVTPSIPSIHVTPSMRKTKVHVTAHPRENEGVIPIWRNHATDPPSPVAQ